MERTIEISFDIYVEWLNQRFNEVPSGWHSEASDELWKNFVEMLGDCPPSAQHSSPMEIVDNYLVNGDFIEREEFENTPDSYSYYDWEDVCANALVSNEKYALMQF